MATPNRNHCAIQNRCGRRNLASARCSRWSRLCGVLLALRQWISSDRHCRDRFSGRYRVFCMSPAMPSARACGKSAISPMPSSSANPAADSSLPQSRKISPPQRISSRGSSLGWMIIIASSIGTTTGAVGGGLWTFVAARGQVGPFDIVVGVIAFAVLGGLAAFATFGFAQVLAGSDLAGMKCRIDVPVQPTSVEIGSKPDRQPLISGITNRTESVVLSLESWYFRVSGSRAIS